MIIKSFLLISGLLIAGVSFSQVDTCWTRSYGGSASEAPGFGTGFIGTPWVKTTVDDQDNVWIVSASQSSDGDVYTNNGGSDIWILKLDSSGDTLFTKSIGGSGTDLATGVVSLDNGGILISGYTQSSDFDFQGTGAKGAEDAILISLDASGNIDWINHYGGSQGDYFFDVVKNDNGYYATGSTGSVDGDITDHQNPGSTDAWVCKIDLSGNIDWSRTTDATTQNNDWTEIFWSATLVPDNKVVLQGITGNFADFNTDDFITVKYDSTGVQEWLTEMGGNARDIATGIVYNPLTEELIGSGAIGAAGGEVTNYYGGTFDFWAYRMDLNGTLLSEKNYGGTDLEYPYGAVLSPSNTVFISGMTRSTDNEASTASFGAIDFWAIELDPYSLDTVNTIRFGGTANDYLHDMAFRANDKPYVVGRSQSDDTYVPSNQGGSDLYIACLDIDATASTIELTDNTMIVSPNPFDRAITVVTSEDWIGASVAVTDALGREVLSTELNASNQEIEMPATLAHGMYTITVQKADQLLQTKLIKN